MKTRYTISLDHQIVEKVKERLKPVGGKLSSLINNLLLDWLRGEEMKEYDIKEWKRLRGIKEEVEK